jgi:hypothetical protein
MILIKVLNRESGDYMKIAVDGVQTTADCSLGKYILISLICSDIESILGLSNFVDGLASYVCDNIYEIDAIDISKYKLYLEF